MTPRPPLFPASPQPLQMQSGPLWRGALPLLQPLLGSWSREGFPRRGSFPPPGKSCSSFKAKVRSSSSGHVLQRPSRQRQRRLCQQRLPSTQCATKPVLPPFPPREMGRTAGSASPGCCAGSMSQYLESSQGRARLRRCSLC